MTARLHDAIVLDGERRLRAIPRMMRAAAIDRFGGPKQLKLHSLQVPEIDEHEVLIAVHAAGVGRWDADMREGFLSGSPKFPLILGTDGSGTVVAVGSRVRRFELGDHVCSYSYENPKGGFYAEYVAVAADKVGHAPKTLTLQEAGAVPTTGLTALQGVDDALRVAKGESVVIHGGSGGVGSLAIQLAKLRMARVLATASRDGGLAFVRRLGADEAIDGSEENLAAAILRWAPDGVDAVLGLAGGPSLDRCIDAVRRGGRVAYPNGVEPVPTRRRGVEFTAYDGIPGVDKFAHLNEAIEASKLKVPITASYPLEEAATAHERLKQRHIFGKIVLRIRAGA